MFKSKLAAFAGSLILAGSVFAGQGVCPSIDAIKSAGIPFAEEVASNVYIGYNVDQFDTDAEWGFALLPIHADSTDMALESANDILSTMTAPGVPQMEGDVTICEYDTGMDDVFAVAIQDGEQITPYKLKHFLNRKAR